MLEILSLILAFLKDSVILYTAFPCHENIHSHIYLKILPVALITCARATTR